MVSEKMIAGIVLMGVGLLFFFKNKDIGRGAFKFYQKFYSEKNLPIMFKICGGIFILGGLVLIFIK